MAICFPASEQTIFAFKGAQLGVLICYESIFPDLARRPSSDGADILVNITNDAWYGESSAPYQLLAMAAMRAVETKTPMVRVANTGISAVIEPTGEITARTPLFKRGTEIETRYLASGHHFLRYGGGSVCAITCFVLTLIGLIAAFMYPRPDGRSSRQTLDRALLFHANGASGR